MTVASKLEGPTPDDLIAENAATLLHRARWSITDLAVAIGMTKQTLTRKINVPGTRWYYDEVAAVASALCVSVEEMATALPTREEWEGRWAVRHQGLEPRTR